MPRGDQPPRRENGARLEMFLNRTSAASETAGSKAQPDAAWFAGCRWVLLFSFCALRKRGAPSPRSAAPVLSQDSCVRQPRTSSGLAKWPGVLCGSFAAQVARSVCLRKVTCPSQCPKVVKDPTDFMRAARLSPRAGVLLTEAPSAPAFCDAAAGRGGSGYAHRQGTGVSSSPAVGVFELQGLSARALALGNEEPQRLRAVKVTTSPL